MPVSTRGLWIARSAPRVRSGPNASIRASGRRDRTVPSVPLAPSRTRSARRRASVTGRSRGGNSDPGEERGSGRRERDNAGLVSYRIEVGHRDGVAPREIVGAIANEAGLEGRFIGRIAIEEDHSLVDLPEGMPREIFQHLRGVFVRGKRLNISLAGTAREPDRGPGKRPFKPRELSPEGHDPGADRRPGPPKGFKPRRPPPTS